MPTPRLARPAAGLLVLAALAGGCGKSDDTNQPRIGKRGSEPHAARSLGFPAFATKNTTRVGGADPVADAAGVAQAVYSAQSATTRPPAVTLVDSADWRSGLAAAVLMAPPVRAPILLTSGKDVPDATRDALAALDPEGTKAVDGAQVVRVGGAAKPSGYKTTTVKGDNPYAIARDLDRLAGAAAGRSADSVMIVSADKPEYALPAAAWAAKSGDPVLYVQRDKVPRETLSALKGHQQPKIYVLGPPSVVSAKVVRRLRRLGTVRRIAGRDPAANAIAFARFIDGRFGWGVVDPGHGLVFVNPDRTLDAAAAAPLSAAGTYGPLLLVDGDGKLSPRLVQYLLDIQPGYRGNPVRGVYNHGWVIGDDKAISVSDQTRIDALLEIAPEYATPAARPSS